MKRKSKVNIFKIIWISGVFLLLIVILLMIMDYKINYEYLTPKKIYFYNCNDSVCSTLVKDSVSKEDLYSIYECGYEICPTIKKAINNSYVVLNSEKLNILYDLKKGKIISDFYDDYQLINDKHFIVTKNNYQGLIDLENNILINTTYEQLGYTQNNLLIGYNVQSIIVKKNNLYGIVTIKDEKIIEKIEYKEDQIEYLLKIINS